MEDSEEEIGVDESREHIGLNRGFFVVSSEEIFMDSKGKFAQNIHRFMGVFSKKTATILRKSNIQNPMHRFDFPMLPGQHHQLLGTDIPAGNVLFPNIKFGNNTI